MGELLDLVEAEYYPWQALEVHHVLELVELPKAVFFSLLHLYPCIFGTLQPKARQLPLTLIITP